MPNKAGDPKFLSFAGLTGLISLHLQTLLYKIRTLESPRLTLYSGWSNKQINDFR